MFERPFLTNHCPITASTYLGLLTSLLYCSTKDLPLLRRSEGRKAPGNNLTALIDDVVYSLDVCQSQLRTRLVLGQDSEDATMSSFEQGRAVMRFDSAVMAFKLAMTSTSQATGPLDWKANEPDITSPWQVSAFFEGLAASSLKYHEDVLTIALRKLSEIDCAHVDLIVTILGHLDSTLENYEHSTMIQANAADDFIAEALRVFESAPFREPPGPAVEKLSLVVRGKILGLCHSARAERLNREIIPKDVEWAKMLYLLSDDKAVRFYHYGITIKYANNKQEFDMRYAAMASLRGFQKSLCLRLFNSTVRVNDMPLASLYALANALIDDDNDIRELAAECVCAITSIEQNEEIAQRPLCPHAALEHFDDTACHQLLRLEGLARRRTRSPNRSVKGCSKNALEH